MSAQPFRNIFVFFATRVLQPPIPIAYEARILNFRSTIPTRGLFTDFIWLRTKHLSFFPFLTTKLS